MIYFDHNATTPMLPEARQAWLDATEKFVGNPSSPHRIGSRADAAITGARQRLAGVLRCGTHQPGRTSEEARTHKTRRPPFLRSLPRNAQGRRSRIEAPVAEG